MEHGRLSSNGYNTAYYISIAERSVFIVVPLEIFRISVQDNAKITFAVFNASPTVCVTKIVIFFEYREIRMDVDTVLQHETPAMIRG